MNLQEDARIKWQPIETAPKDGTFIKAKIPGYGSNNIISWMDGLVDSDDLQCGAWTYGLYDSDGHPDCWDDGICWGVNAVGEKSVEPTHWKAMEELNG